MRSRPNIIFIMLDTARADYVKAYDGKLELPNIDAICGKGAIYENAISPGTYTASSHVSLFTGKRVASVKTLMQDKMKNADRNIDPFLVKSRLIKQGEATLAKKLAYIGYSTALFSNNPLVTKYTGIAEGFSYLSYTDSIAIASANKMSKIGVKAPLSMVGNDTVRNRLLELSYVISRFIPRSSLDKLYLKLRSRLNSSYALESGYYKLDQGACPTNKIVGKYANKTGTEGNFLFINYMEAHEGYPTNLVSKEYVEQDKWLYLSGILDPRESIDKIKQARDKRMFYLDRQIGALLSNLKEKGILDNAVVILSGDHGQGFMEHGQMYHSMFPYNEIVRVPLIAAKFVNGKQINTKERVHEPVSLSALHETVLDIGYGKTDMVDGSVRRDEFVFSDHTGITEVWDTYLLKLIRNRSSFADAIYRAKVRQNAFATAIYKGNCKLIHYRSGKQDELYDIGEDPGETQNILNEKKPLAREMIAADSRTRSPILSS